VHGGEGSSDGSRDEPEPHCRAPTSTDESDGIEPAEAEPNLPSSLGETPDDAADASI